jgi:hypothetical protein
MPNERLNLFQIDNTEIHMDTLNVFAFVNQSTLSPGSANYQFSAGDFTNFSADFDFNQKLM